MENNLLETQITYLKGVGPRRAELLKKELEIITYEDLLNYFPFRYVDKSKFFKVKDVINDAVYFQLKGKVSNLKAVGDKRTKYITADFTDDTGTIGLVWFRGLQWVKNRFVPGKEYIVFGKPSTFKNRFNFVHPEIEDVVEGEPVIQGNRLEGIYRTSEKLKNIGLGTRGISKLMKSLLSQVIDIVPENLPDYIIQRYKLLSRKEALINIHFPVSPEVIKKAELRLKFEELLFVQLQILRDKIFTQQKIRGHIFSEVGSFFNDFYYEHLPFTLTNAQKRVVKEIRIDMKSGRQMNRLLQGDVGSGKTLVALMSMLIAMGNGFQTAMMAPTEILATQHFHSITKMLQDMDIEVGLLTGSTKAAQRKIIHQRLQEGKMQIIIGTHALIEDVVTFQNLGLVIIDEQHRFGVAQRAKLWKKNSVPPHVLVMTATPIPRTLAMTVYGNLDVSVIDELPPGRKAIKTLHFFENKRLRVIGFMRDQIKMGRQVYVVYPLIKESETLDLKNLEEGIEHIQRDFPLPDYQVSVVHGKLKPDEKEAEMKRFVEGKTDIMVSTTVIEVGVDVPNASVMIIENAERFGLSQLHQLRGRVGRGAEQSYCLLLSGNKLSNEGRKRLEIMVQTNDGFEIAEADLKLRGPGDMQGTRQSGMMEFKIVNLAKDGVLVSRTREIAQSVLDKDTLLELPENIRLRNQLVKLKKNETNWGRIS
jgi:ATP-dependent DNA helicase RecG